MTIIVEDGTGIAGANSYITVAEAREFSRLRNVSTGRKTDLQMENLLILAMDYLELKSDEYIGIKNDVDQALSWPRALNNVDLGIPARLKTAQGFLVISLFQGTSLFPTTVPGSAVKREKVGEIEIEYQVSGDVAPGTPRVLAAEQALAPLLRGYVPPGGLPLRSVRV